MSKKICIISNNSVGLYKFRAMLIKELLKEFEVYIMLPDGEGIKQLTELGCVFIETPIDCRGMNPLRDIGLYRRCIKTLKKIKPDAVITYTIKPNIYGCYACKRLKIPYAANITGLGTAFQEGGLIKSLVVRMYKAALKKARVVFFENEGNRQTLCQTGVIPDGSDFLLHGAGVDLDEYKPCVYPEEREETHFLFVGRVMSEKGVDELFYAVERLKQENYPVKLSVVGGCDEKYEPELKRLEKSASVEYFGFRTDVNSFYNNCDCLVLPSYHEGMANVLLEAAATGRPLITSDIYGCREAVENGVSGFLCSPRDKESLYTVLKAFCELPYASRTDMAYKSRELVERAFDKRQVVSDTISALRARNLM